MSLGLGRQKVVKMKWLQLNFKTTESRFKFERFFTARLFTA